MSGNLKRLERVWSLYEGSVGTYIVHKNFCTCPAGLFRSTCKHMKEMEKMPIEFSQVANTVKQYKSSIDEINKIFGGYLYSSDGIVSLVGKAESGKTLFALQESLNLAKQGCNVLYIDSIMPDTPVLIKKNEKIEYVPVEDLWSKRTYGRYCEVKDTYVMTDNGWSKIKYCYRHKIKTKIYKILTRKSYVEVTENHSLVVDGKVVSPKTMKVGDKVNLIRWVADESYKNDPDIAWLIGFFLAEGTCYKHRNKKKGGFRYDWRLVNKNVALLEKARSIMEGKLGLKCNSKLTVVKSEKYDDAYLLSCSKKVAYDLFTSWCYTKSMRKKIPWFILSGTERQAFLDGYMEGDGHIYETGVKQITSVDKCIVAGLATILTSLGMEYSLQNRRDKDTLDIRTLVRPEDWRVMGADVIKKLEAFEYDGYVYDLETENHHFVAGVGNVLVHNTEGGVGSMIKQWWDTLSARFKPVGKLYFEQKKSLEMLHEYLGYKTSIVFRSASKKKDEKGKLEFRVLETIENPEIDKVVKENKISFIVVDTVSSPIRQAFTDQPENFPSKASATALIYGKLLRMQDDYGVGLLTLNQASWNPTTPYGTVMDVDVRGGAVVRYYSKRVLYIDKRETRAARDYRRLWVVRVEDKPRFSNVVFVKITDAGFEPSDKGADELLTDGEKAVVSQ